MTDITTDQMIEWAEREARRAKIVADGMAAKGDLIACGGWMLNQQTTKATADRLRLVRSMVETLRSE
jgi:hypothetical protein